VRVPAFWTAASDPSAAAPAVGAEAETDPEHPARTSAVTAMTALLMIAFLGLFIRFLLEHRSRHWLDRG